MAKNDQSPELDAALLSILDKLAERTQANGLTSEQLEAIMTRVGITSADAMRMSLKPENTDHPHISAFFTAKDAAKYGSYDKKPKLRRKTYFVGVQEKDDNLMPAEIEAFNSIREDAEARNGKWKAKVVRSGNEEILQVQVPVDTLEDRMQLPSLILILHELNGGQSTEDVHQLIRQIEVLKGMAIKKGADVAELEKALLDV